MPRLRGDAYVIPTSDGARVVTNSGSHDFVGPSIYAWLSKLAPYLDGKTDVTAGLSRDKAEMVERIVSALQERELFVDESKVVAGEEVVVEWRRSGDDVWIASGSETESVWLRLRDWQPDVTFSPLEDATAATVVAGIVGMRKLGAQDSRSVTRLHLPTLTCSTHRFVPHPSVTGTSAAGPSGRPGEPTPEEIDEQGAVLVDPRLGVIGEVSERDWAQLPLNVAAATIPGRVLVGAGLTVKDARWMAVRNAMGAYAAAGAMAREGRRGVAHWGRRGVAARYTWEEALRDALMELCATDPASPKGQVRLRAHDEETEAYLRMLAIMGVETTVYDVTRVAPTLAFCAGGRTVACVSGLGAEDTFAEGLRAVLLDEQSRRNGQPDYAPAPVAQLKPTDTEVELEVELPRPRAMKEVLRAVDPMVIPLHHDPELHRIMPCIVMVVARS